MHIPCASNALSRHAVYALRVEIQQYQNSLHTDNRSMQNQRLLVERSARHDLTPDLVP
jgi:hypothetical protein